MKTTSENRKLFEEAHELRINIRKCLHSRAKNSLDNDVCLPKDRQSVSHQNKNNQEKA